MRQIPSPGIRLWIPLGHAVAFGDKVATVRDDDPQDARRLADEIREVVLIGREPDVDMDASTGIAEIGNIAWTSASAAKQNPEIAPRALHVVRDWWPGSSTSHHRAPTTDRCQQRRRTLAAAGAEGVRRLRRHLRQSAHR